MGLHDLYSFNSVEDAISYLSLDHRYDVSFINILKYLKKYHEAKTIIVEDKYIDKDYSNELSNFYSKTFRSRHAYCERLHFIKESFLDKNDFINKLNDGGFTYLGYLIKRPLPVGKVGRTLILSKNIRNYYPLCNIKREVHLLGKTILATGFPFIEQDGMVITCAQASIWMTAKFMHYSHSLPRHLPFDITEYATAAFSYTGRPIPSSGLTIEQMLLALTNMGYFPIYYEKPHIRDYENDANFKRDDSLWQPLDIIYPYIESEIPVIIGLSRHARTVIGHKMHDELTNILSQDVLTEVKRQNERITGLYQKGLSPAIIPSSIFSDGLIVHDDQEGIYRLMPYDRRSYDILKTRYLDLFPSKDSEIESGISSIIIPLPDKIYLSADDDFRLAYYMVFHTQLKHLINQADSGNEYAKLIVESSINEKNPVVFRTYFIKGVDFKGKIRDNINISSRIQNYYLTMEMPRFIWVVEISNYAIYGGTRNILGEIIFDSTANKYDIKGNYLSIHLPGFFYKNEIDPTEQIIDVNIPIEHPYKILDRTPII